MVLARKHTLAVMDGVPMRKRISVESVILRAIISQSRRLSTIGPQNDTFSHNVLLQFAVNHIGCQDK